jgi:IS30 family transposase
VSARRRLRRLVPDAELIRRRATGGPFRELAADYGVAHTTVGRYFARPQVKKELAQARRQLRAEQAARTSEWRRLEPAVRGRANEQAAREREQQKRFQVAWAEQRSRWRPPREQYETLLNEHDAPRLPPTRADQHNTFDDLAAVATTLNGRPRKTLGWKTPAEALDEHLRSCQQHSVATTG